MNGKDEKRIAVAQARASLRRLVGDVHGKGLRIKITRYGKSVACLVPVADLEFLKRCEERKRQRQQAKARQQREPVSPVAREEER